MTFLPGDLMSCLFSCVTAQARGIDNSKHNGSKDAVLRNEGLSQQMVFLYFDILDVTFPQKLPTFAPHREIPVKPKNSK